MTGNDQINTITNKIAVLKRAIRRNRRKNTENAYSMNDYELNDIDYRGDIKYVARGGRVYRRTYYVLYRRRIRFANGKKKK